MMSSRERGCGSEVGRLQLLSCAREIDHSGRSCLELRYSQRPYAASAGDAQTSRYTLRGPQSTGELFVLLFLVSLIFGMENPAPFPAAIFLHHESMMI